MRGAPRRTPLCICRRRHFPRSTPWALPAKPRPSRQPPPPPSPLLPRRPEAGGKQASQRGRGLSTLPAVLTSHVRDALIGSTLRKLLRTRGQIDASSATKIRYKNISRYEQITYWEKVLHPLLSLPPSRVPLRPMSLPSEGKRRTPLKPRSCSLHSSSAPSCWRTTRSLFRQQIARCGAHWGRVTFAFGETLGIDFSGAV